MGRALLKMSNQEIYESSLKFIFKQLDLYVESNKKSNRKMNSNDTKNNRTEETRLRVLD